VSGFASDQGACRIAIYLGPRNFNNLAYAIAKDLVPLKDGIATWKTTLEVPAERAEMFRGQSLPFAVGAFHDENENQKLDKGAFGIPTERYGFSNNPKRGFGPPTFQEAVVSIQPSSIGDTTSVELDVEIQVQ